MPPKFSIIIPTYNRADGRLQRALDSVDRQTWVDWECIVVDDGSTDNTAFIAKKKAKVISHGKNLGYGAAIKTGIRQSSYDTICLLDADHTYPAREIPNMNFL